MEFSIYTLSSKAALELFEDGGLILNLNDISFTELNVTARDILKATDGKATVAQVAQLLAQEYEIERSQALADVSDLYQQLIEQNILELVQPQTNPEDKNGKPSSE